MVRWLLVAVLLLPSCVTVRFTAEVEGVGTIRKTTIAFGNAKIHNASQAVSGLVTEDMIEFSSDSQTELETEEDLSTLLQFIAP